MSSSERHATKNDVEDIEEFKNVICDEEPDDYIPDECCLICFFMGPLNDLNKT